LAGSMNLRFVAILFFCIFWVHCNSKRVIGPKETFEWTVYTIADGLVRNPIFDLAIDSLDRVWIGTLGGINVFDGIKWDTIDVSDGLPYKYATVLHFDHQGNLWIGSGGDANGLVKYDGTSFTLYTTADGLSDNRIESIGSQPNGTIWVGTQEGGACRFDGNQWTCFDTHYVNHVQVYSIYCENDSSIWFGTSDGVTHYNGHQWIKYLRAFGSEPEGFFKQIWAIEIDSMENIWFGCSVGIYKHIDGSIKWVFGSTHDRPEISDIEADSRGNLWCSSYASGFYLYRNGVWSNYSMQDGLPTTWVSSVESDSKGNIWFGTQSGLVKLTIK